MENDKASVQEYLKSIGYFGILYNKNDIRNEISNCYGDGALVSNFNIKQIFDDIVDDMDNFEDCRYDQQGTIYNCVSNYYECDNRHLTTEIATMLDVVCMLDIPEYPYVQGQADEDYDLVPIRKLIEKITKLNELGEQIDEEMIPDMLRDIINEEPELSDLDKLLREQAELTEKIERLQTKKQNHE